MKSALPVKIRFKGPLTSEQFMQKMKHPAFSMSHDAKRFRRRSRKRRPSEHNKEVVDKLGIGSQCKIFSRSFNKWFNGEVCNIIEDTEGTWLEVVWHMNNES